MLKRGHRMICLYKIYGLYGKKRGLVDLNGDDVPNAGKTQKNMYTSSYCRQESNRSLERERCVTAARTEL